MTESLSWSDMASSAGDVVLNVLLACVLASALVYGFALFGRRYSLDQRVFPTVSASQRQWFGLLGFYLLSLTGIEILNPPSLDFVSSGAIAYKPSFLNAQFMGLAAQDLLSIAALTGLLVVFVSRIRQLNRMTSRFTRQELGPARPADEARFSNASKGLKFAFSFAAVSLLIAIIAPGLTIFGAQNIGTIVIVGLFLIGGVSCYLEAMKLGAAYSSESPGVLGALLLRHVFVPQTILYAVLAVAGYSFLSGLPSHYADDPSMAAMPELVRMVSKITAGVLLVMMAFIVCWGVDEFSTRLQRFMVVAALAPMILPMMKLVAVIAGRSESISTDPHGGFSITYGIVLLIAPLLAYIFASSERMLFFGTRVPSLAYVRNMSWAPVAIGRTLGGAAGADRIDYTAYSSAEELLEEMIGRKARGGPVSMTGSSRLRHKLAAPLGWHRDYDAVILDLRSALRLFEGLKGQGRLGSDSGDYRIVAGICHRQDVIIHRHHHAHDDGHARAIWSDAPYMPRNERLEQHILKGMAVYEPEVEGVDFLPPNCILERLGPGDLAAVPEPFATNLLARTESRADTDQLPLDDDDDASWLFHHYDVLIVRHDENGELPDVFLDMLVAGRNWLRTKAGPTGLGGPFARQVAAELEGIDIRELDDENEHFLQPSAVSVCLALTNFQDGSVISPEDASPDSNWRYAQRLHTKMTEAGLLESFTAEDLRKVIDCSAIEERTSGEGPSAVYPLRFNRYLVNDAPGKIRDVLRTLDVDRAGMSFLHAQRVAGASGMALISILPADGEGIVEKRSEDHSQGDEHHHHHDDHDHEWIAGGQTGVLAVHIGNAPASLQSMLEVVHVDPELSIDTLTAFPASAEQAIALLSFGDIPQSRLAEAVGRLERSGYTIASMPGDWAGS